MADENEVSTELAEIQETISSDPRRYWRDTEFQERHLALTEAEISGTPVPAKPSGLQAEKLAIEKAIQEDNGRAYWKSPEMQARYRAILELEESQPAQQHDVPAPVEDITQAVRSNLAQSPERGRNVGTPISVHDTRFKSKAAAARHFGVKPEIFSARLRKNWTPEQAAELDAPPATPEKEGTHVKIGDQEFVSVSAFAKAFDKELTMVKSRLYLGWTPEQAVDLTTPPPPSGERTAYQL